MAKRTAFVVQPERWPWAAAFAYAAYLVAGRGAVVLNLDRLSVEYLVRDEPGEKRPQPDQLKALVEMYEPAREVVCLLLFTLDGAKAMTFHIYRGSAQTPQESYAARLEHLGPCGFAPSQVLHLARRRLLDTLRLS